MHDTLIIIDVQAPNQLEILTCVRETFEFMPGWVFAHNVFNAPTDARFFSFNLSVKVFNWWRENHTFSDTMDEDDVVIKDLADISHLLEFVYLNSEKLRDKVDLNAEFNKFFSVGAQQPEPPPKKRKKDETSAHKINTEKLEQKLKEFQKDFHKPSFNPMVFVEESMSMPSANVYYKDFAPKDLTPEQYDTYYDKALYATSEGELIGLYNKTAGLHGPLATKLGHFINQKIKNLKYPPKTSWGTEEEKHYLHSQQQTLYSKMAGDVAAEIDKEVLAKILTEYEKYAKEAQAKKTQAWYTEASHQSKPWSKGWSYHNPNYDGIMVKSPPYYMVDSMDY